MHRINFVFILTFATTACTKRLYHSTTAAHTHICACCNTGGRVRYFREHTTNQQPPQQNHYYLSLFIIQRPSPYSTCFILVHMHTLSRCYAYRSTTNQNNITACPTSHYYPPSYQTYTPYTEQRQKNRQPENRSHSIELVRMSCTVHRAALVLFIPFLSFSFFEAKRHAVVVKILSTSIRYILLSFDAPVFFSSFFFFFLFLL